MTLSSRRPNNDNLHHHQRHITLNLLRKRSEHNECLISTLEEIALHQEELERIGPLLGKTCGKTLKILLLQNNVIARMDDTDFRLLKNLEYLNLALNNIMMIRGIGHCEWLTKLDLTLNFIDVEGLEESIETLRGCRSLRELYLMGNPCCGVDDSAVSGDDDDDDTEEVSDEQHRERNKFNEKTKRGWVGCRQYVIANLPQLQILDGKEVLRSERIVAMQNLSALRTELRQLAESRRVARQNETSRKTVPPCNIDANDDEQRLTEHTPEVRAEISREMARQKAEKEKKERANMPRRRGETEFEEEQIEARRRAREREERGDIKQCNEGKWEFRFDEEKTPGYVLLDIPIPKFLSSSLIDVDIHPTYVSIIIKSKVLRLVVPAEVNVNESTAQRSTTTGHLLLTMPKVNPKENHVLSSILPQATNDRVSSKKKMKEKKQKTITRLNKCLASDMLNDARKHVTTMDGESVKSTDNDDIGLNEVSSRMKTTTFPFDRTERRESIPNSADNCDDVETEEPPPLF